MALRPTIYKARIALSDLDRQIYDTLNLTVARHPSETAERMLARVLAYCLNAQPELSFCKGLSDAEEPDLWARTLDGRIALWIEVGEPAFDRLRKASRMAEAVRVYSFNHKSPVWWSQGRDKLGTLPVEIYQFAWPAMQALGAMAERNLDWSVTVSGDTLLVAGEAGECEVTCSALQAASP